MKKRMNHVDRLTVMAAIATMTLVAVAALASPAFAHHPFGEAVPNSWFQGLVSGIGHPTLGPDHLMFIVAVGLLSSLFGLGVPVAFVVASLVGTGLHLLLLSLPAPELGIAASVLVVGLLLAYRRGSAAVAVSLAALAGVFHGYAYGEAVIGAEMTPLLAYLLGFSIVQLAIALAARQLGQQLQQRGEALRFAGFALSGAGAAFISNIIL